MVIRYLSHWVRSFIFLIMDRLLRDNRGVMIMKDPSFLIRGVWIMETGHFSFHTSLLSRLYHLIIWHGGFNSEPGPVYFGMDRISPWAELFYWVCPSNPFIRRTFGLTVDPQFCHSTLTFILWVSRYPSFSYSTVRAL